MDNEDLAWTVEEACQNAWPSPRQLLLEGWLLRASGGPTRRTNSLNPLRGGPRDPSGIVDATEAIYRSLGQAPIFRVPSLVPEMDEPLAQLGYVAEAETCALLADDLAGSRRPGGSAVELSDGASEAWLAGWATLNSASEERRRSYRAMTDCILPPRAYAARRLEGRIVAIAYGVLHRNLLVVESVATDPAHRRRGYGAETVGSLLEWARRRSATAACLQVVADNTAARALYASLGFSKELYRYHYRRKVRPD